MTCICINNSLHLARKYARIFVPRQSLSKKQRVLQEQKSFEQQIISKDKYPSTFSRQIKPAMFAIYQVVIFCNMRHGFEKRGISLGYPLHWPTENRHVLANAYQTKECNDTRRTEECNDTKSSLLPSHAFSNQVHAQHAQLRFVDKHWRRLDFVSLHSFVW